MKKLLSRILSIATAALLLIGSMPVSALAEVYTGSTGGVSITETPAAETVSVTFIDMGNETKQTVSKGGSIAPLPKPEKDGYVFKGWYETNAEGAEVEVTTLDSLQRDYVLTAKYAKQYTVTYKNPFDPTWTDVVVPVEEGSSFDAAGHIDLTAHQPLYDDDFAFSGWTPASFASVTQNEEVTATFKELKSFTVTIRYILRLEDSEKVAADPYVASVKENDTLEGVASPTIAGYELENAADAVVSHSEPITDNFEITVYYVPKSDNPYTVHFYAQNVAGSGYDEVPDTALSRGGKTGADTQVTLDDAQAVLEKLGEGFTLATDMAIVNKSIAADGTTNINVYFDRVMSYVLFDTADGTYIEPQTGLFGTAVVMPAANPERNGYTFKSWDVTIATIPSTPATITAVWEAIEVEYTVVVWRENLDGSYGALGSFKEKAKTGTEIKYTADDFTGIDGVTIDRLVNSNKTYETLNYFTYSKDITLAKNGGAMPTVKGDGSTTVGVYYTRDTFSVGFVLTDANRTLVTRGGEKYSNGNNTSTVVYEIKDKMYEEDIADLYPVQVLDSNGNEITTFAGFTKKSGTTNTEVTSTRRQMDVNLCDTSSAHYARYNAQYKSFQVYETLIYLLEKLDGTYISAGYDQTFALQGAGGITHGQTNKGMRGYKIAGSVTYTSGDVNSSDPYVFLYDGSENGMGVVNMALSYDNIASALKGGTWTEYKTGMDKDPVNPVKTTGKNKLYNASILWYTRLKYTLTFQNGNLSTSVKDIPFERDISSEEPAVTSIQRPAGVDETYVFGGWYTDPSFSEDGKFTWADATMPAADLVLFARWIKPEFKVTFDVTGGKEETKPEDQNVAKNETAAPVNTPVRDGYKFDYWYYVDEAGEHPFTFSVKVNRHYDLFAHWTASAVEYTVVYQYANKNADNNGKGTTLYDKDGNVVETPVILKGMVGDSITAEAPDLYTANHEPLFPDFFSQSITLKAASGDNVITFVYTKKEIVNYTVRYVRESDGAEIAQAEAGSTTKNVITLNAKSIQGYTPVVFQITRALSATDAENVITFTYRPNPTGMYTVHYYLQNLNDNGYTEVEDENTPEDVSDRALGSLARATEREYAGFVYNAAVSKPTGIVYTDNGTGHLQLRMYYNRAIVDYGAHFVVELADGARETIAPDTTFSARFGKTMQVVAKAIDSYVLQGDSTADVLVSAIAEDNYHTFVYKQLEGLAYYVRYLCRADNGEVVELYGSDAITHESDGRHLIKLGSTYTWELADTSYIFNGETYHHDANDATTKSVTIAQNGNYIDFYFLPETYTLRYNANGGTNAPADRPNNRYNATVTLSTAEPVPSDDEYTFVGWTENANVAPVYETEEALRAVELCGPTLTMPKGDKTVYAVWSHLQATLTYASTEAFVGTLPTEQTQLLNTAITVSDSNGISRAGYTFAGWSLNDSSNRLYGPNTANTTIAISVNTTLYAVWTPVSYTVNYHLAYEQSNLPESTSWTNPNTITSYNITSDAFTIEAASKSGYAFEGWYSDEACTEAANTTIVTGSTGNRDFYAKFAVIVPQLSLTGVDVTYDGAAHAVTLNGNLLGTDTVTYTVNGDTVDNAFVNATTGTTVTAHVWRDGSDIWQGDASVVIRQRPVTVTAASATNLTYTGEPQSIPAPQYAYTLEGENIGVLTGHTLTAVVTGATRTDAGSNPVTLSDITVMNGTDNVTANYTFTNVSGEIVIAQANATATVEPAEHVYDAVAVGFNAPTLLDASKNPVTSGVTVAWRYTDDPENTWRTEALPTYADVKSVTRGRADAYEIQLKLSHANYADAFVTAKLTVTPAPVTLSVNSKTDFVYTVDAEGNATVWSVDATYQLGELAANTLYAGDTITYELTGGTRSAIGNNAVTFADGYGVTNADHAKNYAITVNNGRIGVAANTAEATLTARDQVFDYTASAHTMAQPTVTVGSADMTALYSFQYNVTDANGSVTNTTSLPTFTNAGAYTVTINASLSGYASPEAVTVTITVNKATVTITSGSLTVPYDAAEHSVNVADSVSGLVTTEHRIGDAPITDGQVNSAVNAGTYPVQANASAVTVLDANGSDVTANYNVVTAAGMLSITKAPLTVTTASQIFAFDGNEHELAVTVEGLKGGDKSDYSIDSASAVGTYHFTPSVSVLHADNSDAIANYDPIINVGGDMTIIDFTATGVNTTYDGAEHSIAYTVPAGYEASYTVTYTDGNGNAVPASYTNVVNSQAVVHFTPTAAGLPSAERNVNVIIVPRSVTLQVNDINKVYDGMGAQLTVSIADGAAATEADKAAIFGNLVLTNTAGTVYPSSQSFVNATNEHITASVNTAASALLANYTFINAETNVVISQRPVNVYYQNSPLNAVFDEQAHALLAVAESESAGRGVLGSLNHAATIVEGDGFEQTNVTNGEVIVGFTSVTIMSGSDDVTANYAINEIDGRISITQSTLTLTLAPYSDTYDGQPHGVTVVSVKDASGRIIDPSHFTWTFNGEASADQTNVGHTDVTVVGTSLNPTNYPNVSGTSTIDIAARRLTLTADSSLGNVYDGVTAFTVDSFTTDENEAAGETAAADLIGNSGVGAGNTAIDAGLYTVKVDRTSVVISNANGDVTTANYELSFADGKLEIKQATATADPTSVDYTYNAAEHTFTVPTLEFGGSAVTQPVTVEWRVHGDTEWQTGDLRTYIYSDSEYSGSGDRGEPSSYTVHPYVLDVKLTSDNFLPVETTASMTIQRAKLTIGANDGHFVFDGEEKRLTMIVTGLQSASETIVYDFMRDCENGWIDATFGEDDPLSLRGGHPVRVKLSSVAVADAQGNTVADSYAISTYDAAIIIEPQATSAQPVSDTVIYNGGVQSYPVPTLLDASGNAIPTRLITYYYRLTDADEWSKTAPTTVNAGTTTVQVRMTTPNYKASQTTSTLTVNPLPISVQAPSGSFPYMMDADNTPHVYTLNIADAKLAEGSNALVTGHTFTATFVEGTQSASAIGTTAVQLAGVTVNGGTAENPTDETNNYAITLVDGSLVISASTEAALISVNGDSKQYDAIAMELTQPTISVLSTDGVTRVDRFADFDVTYTVTSDVFEGEQVFRNKLPKYTDAGVYSITVSATSDKFPTAPADATCTLTITKAPLGLASGIDTFEYDATEHTVTDLAIANGQLYDGAQLSYNVNDTNKRTEVGDNAVVASDIKVMKGRTDVTANYELGYTEGHITVTQLSTGGLSMSGYTDVYDALAHGATLSDTFAIAGGKTFSIANDKTADGAKRFTVSYTTVDANGATSTTDANPTFTDAGVYTVIAAVTDVTGNMFISPASATVTITARPVAVAGNTVTGIPYDGLNHTMPTDGYTVERATDTSKTGLLGSDAATATVDNTPERIFPNTYAVGVSSATVTAGKQSNYAFSYTDGSLQIVAANGLTVTVTPNDAMYDGEPHGYTITTNAPANADVTYYVNGATTPTALADMPTYIDYRDGGYPLTVVAHSPYYTADASGSGTLIVSKRPLTVTSGDNTASPYTYNGTEQSVEAMLAAPNQPYGLAAGDEFDLTNEFGAPVFATGASNAGTDTCDRDVTLTGVTLKGAHGGDTYNVTGNYELTYTNGHIVIVKAASRTANTADTQPYNGTVHDFILPTLTAENGDALTGVSYEYSLDNGATWIATPGGHKDVLRSASNAATAYTVLVRMSHANYDTKTATAALTVTPAEITVKADDKQYPYALDKNGAAIVRTVDTVTLTGTLYENAELDPTFADNTRSGYGKQTVFLTGVKVGVKTADGTLEPDLTKNYNITRLDGSLDIVRGTDGVTIDVEGDTVVYDALPHSIEAPRVLVTAEGESLDRTDEFDITYDLTYTPFGGAAEAPQLGLTAVSGTEAGTYAITVHAAAEQYAQPDPVTATLTVNRRTLTVTSGSNAAAPFTFTGRAQSVDAAVSYGAANAATDLLIGNIAGSQKVANVTYAANLTNTNTDVVDRAVRVSSLSVMDGRTDKTSNYLFNITDGRIVIVPLTIPAASIPVRDVDETYDGNEYGLTLPETVRTDAGTLTVADEFTAQYEYNGVTTDDCPTFIDAGSYPITVKLTSVSGNYAPENVTATVLIRPRALTVTYGKLTADYDEAEHTVDRTVEGLLDRDALTLTELNRSSIDATRNDANEFATVTSTATAYAIVAADDASINREGNYTVTVKSGTLLVKPIPLTVTAGTQTYEYNAAEQTVSDSSLNGTPVSGHSVSVTLGNNAATDVVVKQPVSVASASVLNASGADVTRNYDVSTVDGSLTITPAPLTLGVTTVSVPYDGLDHSPEGYVVSGIKGRDYLSAYALGGMPKSAVGTYNRVAYTRTATVLRNRTTGATATANYTITYRTGSLTITAPTTTYSVAYYYDGVLGATDTLTGTVGRTVTTYAARERTGYTFDYATGAPLTLSDTAANNVIRVYYVSVATPDLVTLTDADIPLAGNMASLNVGAAVE